MIGLAFHVIAFLVLVVNCQQPTPLPATVQAIVNAIPNGAAIVNTSFSGYLQIELNTLTSINSGNVMNVFGPLLTAAQNLINQTTALVQTAQANINSALQTLANQIVQNADASNLLSNLILSFGDARAAVQLECAGLQNLSQVAVAAVQDATFAKLNATLTSQNLLIWASLNIAQLTLNPAQLQALAYQIAVARAQANFYDYALVTLIPQFIANNTQSIANCFSSLQNNTAALALGFYANYTTLKSNIFSDVVSFNSKLVSIISAALNQTGVVLNAQTLNPVYDDVLKQVNISLQISLDALSPQARLSVNLTIQAALQGLTLGRVYVVQFSSSKRSGVGTLLAVVQGVNNYLSAPPPNLQTVYQALQNNSGIVSLYNQLEQQVSSLTLAQFATIKAAIQQNLTAAITALQAAQAVYQQKSQYLVGNISATKSAIQAGALKAVNIIQLVLLTRKAEVEAAIADISTQIQQWNASIPSAQSEIEAIQETLLQVQASIANASGNLLTRLQAQQTVLLGALKANAGKLLEAEISLPNITTALNAVLAKFQAERQILLQNITDITLYALNATAASIQSHISSTFALIQTRLNTLATDLNTGVQSVNTSAYSIITNGVQITLQIAFDNTTSVDQIIPVIRAILQAEFFTSQVSITIVSSKRDASSVTLQSQVSSQSSSSSSSSPAPIALFVGIAVGIVVVIIIVVIVIVVLAKKREDDEYNSMRA